MPAAAAIESLLTVDGAADLASLGPVDVVAAVHAHNQARPAPQVVQAVATGLAKWSGSRRVAMLVADEGSQDFARDVLRASCREPAPSILFRVLDFARPASRGQATVGLLAAARAVGAKACALVGAELVGFRPEWVDALLGPVVRGEADYVSPTYSRSMSEGTLTTNVLAPLTRALYGTRVQQVAGGCAGLTGDFIDRCLGGAPAIGDGSAQGVEISLVTGALASGARLVETHLGRKPVDPGAAQPDLATTIVRTVGPLFTLMERHHAAWRDVRGSTAPPQLGDPVEAPADPGDPPRVERMVNAFKLGLKDLLPVWEQILPETTLFQLYPLGLLAAEEFHFRPPLWARVVSDFAVAYHERRLPHDHLLRALTPLYLGRVAAFLAEARARPPVGAADVLETIARAFEAEKEHLVARWR